MEINTIKRQNSGYLFLLVTVFLFSTYEVTNKMLSGRIDIFQINFIRFFVGGLILLLVAAVKKELSISLRDFVLCALAGILNVVVSMSLINMSLAINGSSAAVSAVLFSCNPIFVSVFASFFDGEKIGPKKGAALALGVAGTVLISINKMDLNLRSLTSPALAVLSALFFGLYTVLGKKISIRTGSLRMNAYGFLSGSLILLVLLAAFKRPVISFDYSISGLVIYLSVFVTGLAYLAYFTGLTIAGAGKGSLVFFLKPVLASVLAILFLGERVNAFVITGVILILVGIGVATAIKSEPV